MNIKKRKFLKKLLVISLASSTIFGSISSQQIVEAKKKNHKPKLKFKGQLKKKKIVLKEGQKLNLKVTAKDKEDGNLTNKIKIKVKKPLFGKYKKGGNYIKFLNDGTYKITISVKDKKKKEAQAIRTIVVKEKETEPRAIATEIPNEPYYPLPTSSTKPTESQATTKPTKTPKPIVPERPIETPKPVAPERPIETPKPVITEKPIEIPKPVITEKPIETPKPVITEKPEVTPSPLPTETPEPSIFNPNVIKYNAIDKVFNGNTYHVTTEQITNSNFNKDSVANSPKLKIENDYITITFDIESNYFDNDEYLKYLGKITATDYLGNDISDNIIISTNEKYDANGNIKNEVDKYYQAYIYVEDSEGNAFTENILIKLKKFTKFERQRIQQVPQNYQDLLEGYPWPVFVQERYMVAEFDKPGLLTLKKGLK